MTADRGEEVDPVFIEKILAKCMVYRAAAKVEKGKILALQTTAINEHGTYQPVVEAMAEHKAETFN